jgi:hypothetical protein
MSNKITDSSSTEDYKSEEVGYGRPPKQHQFRKGQSGSPKGRRRKGQLKVNLKAMAHEEFFRLITVTENGKTRRMPIIQLLLRKNLAAATNGAGSVSKLVSDFMRWLMQTNGEFTAEESIEDMFNYTTILNILPGTDMPENPVL